MNSLYHFLAMGGYAIYVWPAYGITLVVFAINLISAIKEKKKITRLMKQAHES